jgi:hypothetical protein
VKVAMMSSSSSAASTAIKTTSKRGGGGNLYQRYVPYILRACLNPFTLIAMTKAYFVSLCDINYLKEVSIEYKMCVWWFVCSLVCLVGCLLFIFLERDGYSMVVIETFGKRLDSRRRPTTVTRQLHAHTPRSMYISACLDFDANPIKPNTTTRFACVGLSGTSIQYSPQLFFIRRYKFFASIRRRNSYMVVDGI